MKTPNLPKEEPEDNLPDWHEPFPEPNTFPSGWNMSLIVSTPLSAVNMESDEEAED